MSKSALQDQKWQSVGSKQGIVAGDAASSAKIDFGHPTGHGLSEMKAPGRVKQKTETNVWQKIADRTKGRVARFLAKRSRKSGTKRNFKKWEGLVVMIYSITETFKMTLYSAKRSRLSLSGFGATFWDPYSGWDCLDLGVNNLVEGLPDIIKYLY